MKKIIFIIIVLFLSNTSKAQMIKLFDFIKAKEDSISTTYSAKVEFDVSLDKDKRLQLVKIELNNNYQITSDKIISIQSFMDKRFRTYRYEIVVKKE
jgi:hypothetical protein